MIRFFISFWAIGFVFFSACLCTVNAQEQSKLSNDENVAIFFYKAGGLVPNFDRWIRERPPYKTISPARRNQVFLKEKKRLQKKYQTLNLSKDYISIKTFVRLLPEMLTNKDGKKSYFVKVIFDQGLDVFYFPYIFLEERIAVVPDQLQKHMSAEIESYQYDFISSYATGSSTFPMNIQLRVLQADLSQPYKMDGVEQWVLLTDVVSLDVWNQSNRLLWQYTAPWYISSETKDLYSLRDRGGVRSDPIKSIK